MEKLLDKINSPKDLKKLPIDKLAPLASELRELILETVSKNGGHLAPNLGVIELTIALHYVFNSPHDKIVWDVGHQSYAHKLLTGRRDRFHTLRQHKGISGFPRRDESEHDAFNTGHASTSISSGLGICEALAHLNGKKKSGRVLSVIGDGALTGGIALEGLNQAGHLKSNLIVIFNDNEMSIAPNVGALQAFVSRKLTGEFSLKIRKEIKNLMESVPSVGKNLYQILKKADGMVKRFLTPGLLFEAFGFRYVGPIQGHNIPKLIQTFEDLKDEEGPLLIHVATCKGKGYQYSEDNPETFHGIGPFKVENPFANNGKGAPTYTDVFGNTLTELARKDSNIVAITAAMRKGTGLEKFAKEFPKRCYDVGIAEQHATTFAAGLATQGLKPVIALYSTFLQRAFDQVVVDVCLQNLPILFAIDRAGIVGNDGSTHQGVFDLSFLRTIPNITIMAPKDELELKDMLFTGLSLGTPAAVRYPRGKGLGIPIDREPKIIEKGTAEIVYSDSEKSDLLIIAIGNMVAPSIEAATNLSNNGINSTVINARFAKPLDEKTILREAKKTNQIITVEENVLAGGFGSAVLESLVANGVQKPVLRLGIPDNFVEHGAQKMMRAKFSLDTDGILNKALEILPQKRKKSDKEHSKKSSTDKKIHANA